MTVTFSSPACLAINKMLNKDHQSENTSTRGCRLRQTKSVTLFRKFLLAVFYITVQLLGFSGLTLISSVHDRVHHKVHFSNLSPG